MADTVGRVEVSVHSDTKPMVAEIKAAGRTAGEDFGKDFGDGFCKHASERMKKCLDKNMKEHEKDWEKQGEKDGKNYGKGFSGKGMGGFSKRMRLIMGALVALAEPLGVALEGAAGAVLGLGSSLAYAAGAAGALVPLLAGMAAGLGAVVIGSQGVGDAFKSITKEWKASVEEGRAFNIQAEGIQKALKHLSPEAKKTAIAFAGMQKPLEDMRKQIQDALFKDMADVLDDLAKNVLPGVADGLTAVAGSVNHTAKGFASMLKSVKVGDIIGGLAPAMSVVGDAFNAFAEGFLIFIRAATPAASALAERIKATAESFKEMMSAGEKSGAINDFLMTAQEHLSAWWDLLKAAAGALGTIAKAGQSFGLSWVESLTGVINKWNEWMKTAEGQTALQTFFTNTQAIMKAFIPVLQGLQGFFKNLVTPDSIQRFSELAASIGGILPVIGQLLSVIGQTGIINAMAEALNMVGQAIQPIIPFLSQMAGMISTTLGSMLQALGPVLTTLGTSLAGVFEAIMPSLQTFLTVFSESFAKLMPAIQPLIEALGNLLATVLPPLLDAITPIIPVIADLAATIATALVPIIDALAPILAELAPVFVQLFIALNPVMRVLVLLGPVLGALAPIISTVLTWLLKLIEPIVPLIGWIASLVISFMSWNKVFGMLGGLFGKVGGWISEAIGPIKTFFSSVGEAFSALKSIFSTIGNAIGGVLSRIGGVIGNFIMAIRIIWNVLIDILLAPFRLWVAGVRLYIGIVKNVFSTVWSFISGIVGRIVGLFTSMPGKVKNALSGIATIFTNIMSSAYNVVKKWIDKITGFFKRGIDKIKGWIPGLARGGIALSPMVRTIGEEGPEAVIPLARPLHQVDASVRGMAALIRGQAPPPGTPAPAGSGNGGGGMTNYWTINTPSQDGRVVAAQVVNRMAAMAG